MNQPDPPADLLGFALTHRLFRYELPLLVAAFAGAAGSGPLPEPLEDHLRLVCEHLERHHREEDEFLWPLLVVRAPQATARLAGLEAEHAELDPLLARIRDRHRPRPDRAADLSRLTALLLVHLDAEDRDIVPLLRMHITPAEQDEATARSRSRIPASDELRVLALMLHRAGPDERARLLDLVPPEAAEAWRTLAGPALAAVHDQLERRAVPAAPTTPAVPTTPAAPTTPAVPAAPVTGAAR